MQEGLFDIFDGGKKFQLPELPTNFMWGGTMAKIEMLHCF